MTTIKEKEIMRKMLAELTNVNIDKFVAGIRRETGDPEELTQNIWYVWSPVGIGMTREGKTRSYYGERSMCTTCEIFSWDLSSSAPCADIATECASCRFEAFKSRNNIVH